MNVKREDGRVIVDMSEREALSIANSLAHEHNLLLRRKSVRASVKAMECAELGRYIDALRGTEDWSK